jgi:hypothetical protein
MQNREGEMQPKEFLFEEYKRLTDLIKHYQLMYMRTEQLTFGAVIATYGFLLLRGGETSWMVWWAIPAIILIPAVRCFALYWVINRTIAPELCDIETALYEGKFKGHETRHTEHRIVGRFPARWAHLAFNLSVWGGLFLITLAAALARQDIVKLSYCIA